MNWAKPEMDDTSWDEVDITKLWDKQGFPQNTHAYGWYRIHVVIPKSVFQGADQQNAIILNMPKADDVDECFLNGKLMLSFTMRYGADGLHKLYYSYVNDDYDTLLTPPHQLFEYPKACSCIDSDITRVGDKYHLYYVAHDTDDSGVKHAVSDHATGPYTYEPGWCDPEQTACEAPTLWQMIGRDEWILMYDVFSARPNNMGFSATTDFVHYTDLGHFNQGEMKTTNFTSPKHGAVIQITKKELRRLQRQWKFEL